MKYIKRYWSKVFRIPIMLVLVPLKLIGELSEYLINNYIDVYLPGGHRG